MAHAPEPDVFQPHPFIALGDVQQHCATTNLIGAFRSGETLLRNKLPPHRSLRRVTRTGMIILPTDGP